MFNVTVLKMKDILKYLVGIIITIAFIIYTTRYFSSTSKKHKEENKQSSTKTIQLGSLKGCLDKTIPTISSLNSDTNSEDNKKTKQNNYLEEFLATEISSLKEIDKMESSEQHEESNNTEEKNKETANTSSKNVENTSKEEIKLADNTLVQTQVVTQNPISENYNSQYGKVKIKNQTTYKLNEENLKPDIKIENKNILIFHTHSCESYTPSEKYPYTQTGNYRTTDLNYTVTRVGTELENYLKQYNFNVAHNTSYHDYPSYNGSYTRSLQTVESMKQSTPADIIIDLHRDAVGSRPDYAPTVKIGDEYAAQIMFVIGTNEGGLWHPNWNENLKFAIKIQEKAEEMYPGLFKPIMLTKSRYNQHSGKFANIMEVGSTGNTLEQCLTSMKFLSAVINAAINQ